MEGVKFIHAGHRQRRQGLRLGGHVIRRRPCGLKGLARPAHQELLPRWGDLHNFFKKFGGKKMKKRLFAILCAAAMAVSLTACGSKTDRHVYRHRIGERDKRGSLRHD
jgi:hypothetical protein